MKTEKTGLHLSIDSIEWTRNKMHQLNLKGLNMMKIYQLPINKNQKLLLYLLKDMGADNEPVQLTLEKVAEMVGISRLTANTNMKELKQMELVTVNVGKGKASNSYTLNIPATTTERMGKRQMKQYTLYKNGVYLKESGTMKELSDWLENIIGGSLYEGLRALRDGWIPEAHSQLSGYTVTTK